MKFILVYNAAGTCYLTAAGELDLIGRPGHAEPLTFDTREEADSYACLTQDGGRVQELPHG